MMKPPSSPPAPPPGANARHERRRLQTPAGRLRLMSYLEGASLLVLVGVAVPLKHAGGRPEFVALVGPLHGVMFLLYTLWLIEGAVGGGWGAARVGKILLASFVPFGFLLVGRTLARLDREPGS